MKTTPLTIKNTPSPLPTLNKKITTSIKGYFELENGEVINDKKPEIFIKVIDSKKTKVYAIGKVKEDKTFYIEDILITENEETIIVSFNAICCAKDYKVKIIKGQNKDLGIVKFDNVQPGM